MTYSIRRLLAAASVAAIAAACAVLPNTTQSESPTSLWVIDLIRTLPGAQDEYLRNIRGNWGNARSIAVERGEVLSYRALAAAPDSARGWDVLLMTEYRDSASFANREANFQEIFADARYVRGRVTVRPSAELRVFTVSEVVSRNVSSGQR